MALLSNSELCLLYNEAAAAVVCGDSEPAVRFSEAVVAEMRSARDASVTEKIEEVLAQAHDFLASGDGHAALLNVIALEVLPEAAACAGASRACGEHFGAILAAAVDHCSPHEGFSLTMESSHILSMSHWETSWVAIQFLLRTIPVLLLRIPRRRHLFLTGAADAVLALAHPLGIAMRREQAALVCLEEELRLCPIPPPTPVSISYAAMQQRRLGGARPEALKDEEGGSKGECGFGRGCDAFATCVEGLVDIATMNGEVSDTAPASMSLRRLLVKLLEELALETGTTQYEFSSEGSGAAASLAMRMVALLPRLGVSSDDFFQPISEWSRSWGLTEASDDDDSDDGVPDTGEAALMRSLLIFWILSVPAGPQDQLKAGSEISLLSEAYFTLMGEASVRQSIPLALKALGLVSAAGKLPSGRRNVIPAQLIESLVMTMTQHPVKSIRTAAHRSLEGLLEQMPGNERLQMYASMVEAASPAVAAAMLQHLQHEIIKTHTWGESVKYCPSVDPHKTQRLSRDTLFGILATWINPDGARGWRVEGLLESLEPLSAALSILRYLLMQRQDANSSNTDSKRIEAMTLGEASFCNAAEPWLLSLLKDCDAVSTDNDEEGLPSSDDIESESKLALILGLHRVTEVAKWSLEALLHVLGKGADDM